MAAIRQNSGKPWFYALILLLIGLLAHGYALPSLGYYWDDWEVVFLLNAKNAALFSGYFSFDRPFAWPYQLMYAVFGLKPLAWHVVTLILRWAGVILLYLSLRMVWPRYETYLRWLGALLLVYPGFLQQSISAAYNRHFTAFFLFALSLYLMAAALRDPARARLLLPLSWLTAFMQVFTIEYFVGLELLRPILLWLLLGNAVPGENSRRLGKTALLSLPYLMVLGCFFWWRLAIFPATIAKANYAGDFKLLQDFHNSLLLGSLAVLTRAIQDLLYSTIQVWLSIMSATGAISFQSKIAWFAIGIGAIAAALFGGAFAEENGPEPPTNGHLKSLTGFGLAAFVVSGLPFWLTSKQLSGGGRWDDRFSLAPMLGAGILTIALIIWLVRPRARKVLLGVLLALSIATQIVVVNKYRLDWGVQNSYYWQLAWRAPGLLPGTAIVSFEQPSESIPGYDASFAMNVLFGGKVDETSIPYWFFTNDRFLNFELRPGKAITFKDRNLRFSGNTSEAIAIVHQGEKRCLQVLDAAYADEPFYAVGQEQLVGLSNTDRIVTDPSRVLPVPELFGPEPARGWCYYFEKADLARQLQDWPRVTQLYSEAGAKGLSPMFGPEYVPFIEAFARTGNSQQALELSRAARASVAEMDPLLCAVWAQLGKLPLVDAGVVQQANAEFACAPR